MGQLISIQFINFAVITTVKGTVGLGLVPIARLIKIEDELALHCILLYNFESPGSYIVHVFLTVKCPIIENLDGANLFEYIILIAECPYVGQLTNSPAITLFLILQLIQW